MSNQLSRHLIVVLAATMFNGCASQQEDGLDISHNTANSLQGRFAQNGQQISFDITRDSVCHTLNIQRSSGEPLVRMALCNDGDTVDLGNVLHAAGPSGALLSGIPLTPVNASLNSPEVASLLADPSFTLLRDFSTELAQELHVDPSLRLPSDLMVPTPLALAPSSGGDVCRAGCGVWGVGCLSVAAQAPFPANLIAAAVCVATTIACEAACPP